MQGNFFHNFPHEKHRRIFTASVDGDEFINLTAGHWQQKRTMIMFFQRFFHTSVPMIGVFFLCINMCSQI